MARRIKVTGGKLDDLFREYILPYLAIILTVIVLLTGYIALQTQADLVENCEKNGNPLRVGVTKLLENDERRIKKEIIQSRQVDYAKLFPSYDKAKLEILIEKHREELLNELQDTEELTRINKPINCGEQF